jgi:hypothetical protein
MARHHRGNVRRGSRKLTFWLVLGGAALISAVVAPLGFVVFKLHHIAVFYGFGLAALSFLFARLALEVDARERGVATGGFAGVDALVFMFTRCAWYPQPLLMLALGFATLIVGAVAGNPARDPDNPYRAGAPTRGTDDAPRPADKPDKPADVKFERPKPPPPATQYPGLVACWAFDEGAGDKARDASPKQLEATVHGAKWVPGIRGQALELSGAAADFVDLGRSPALDFAAGAPFTIAGWVSVPAGRKHGAVLSFRDENQGLAMIAVLVSDRQLQALVRQDGVGLIPAEVRTQARLLPDEWHHFALTRDPSGAIELFLDGASAGKNPAKYSQGKITTQLRALGQEAYWHKRNEATPEQRYLQGRVDELCVFDRVLVPAEIAGLAGRAH